jgi:hypothetical protein
MDQLRETLRPLTDWLPPDVRDRLDVEVWALIFLVGGLIALLVGAALLRRLWRKLFGGRKEPADWDERHREVLSECPLPVRPPAPHVLTVYHLPVRLRLVILAPAGKEVEVDATAVEKLLDKLLPGLGAVAANDKPKIRVWPPQLSTQGFVHAFHRCTVRPEPDGEASRWILAAGRTQVGRQPVLLGLGLWAEEPNTIGRVNLEPHQWRDVLRLRAPEQ